MKKEELEELNKWFRSLGKRCPGCKDTNFTSSAFKDEHKCFSCGRIFTDKSALPPINKINEIKESS